MKEPSWEYLALVEFIKKNPDAHSIEFFHGGIMAGLKRIASTLPEGWEPTTGGDGYSRWHEQLLIKKKIEAMIKE